MTAPDYEAKARAIVDKCFRHDCYPDDNAPECAECLAENEAMTLFASALRDAHAAGRREEREEAGRRVSIFTNQIAHRWVRIPHNSSDGKARDRMIEDCASGLMDPVKELARIRALAAPAKEGT